MKSLGFSSIRLSSLNEDSFTLSSFVSGLTALGRTCIPPVTGVRGKAFSPLPLIMTTEGDC